MRCPGLDGRLTGLGCRSTAATPAIAFVYWANCTSGTIGRANLDGTGGTQSFIGRPASPIGVAVDCTHVDSANYASGTIGRANLNGTNPNQNFIGGANSPIGVAVDGAYVYWANYA